MNDLTNKVALVTGAGQGLGSVIAQTLAAAGVKLILGDVQEDKVKQVAKDITAQSGSAEGMALDVTRSDAIEQAVDEIVQKYKTIDILINNAGLDFSQSIEEFSLEQVETEFRVNLIGPYLLCRKIAPIMYKQRSGNIINIGSTAAFTAWEYTTAYHATKWGLRGMTYGLHTEAKHHNVKVTFMVPGGMKTAHVLEQWQDKGVDLSWLQPPENVAESIKFILQMPGVSTIPEMMVIPIDDWSLFPTSDKLVDYAPTRSKE